MKKILVCLSSLGNSNGVASFFMSYYPELIKDGYKIDFYLIRDDIQMSKRYIDTIQKNNGRILIAESHNKINRYFKVKKSLKKYLKNNYDIVHVNLVNVYAYACIKAVKKYSPNTKIIYHVHNPNFRMNFIGNVLNKLCINFSDKKIACTEDAGKSMFQNQNFTIIKNAINIEKYKFNLSSRQKIRKKYNINENQFVIGTVARITKQKNPFFIIDILECIKKVNEKVKLLWIGEGTLEKSIVEYIKEKKLEENVLIIKNVENVYEFYSAMDAFLLPSLFEGLGIVFVEAQANGLRVYASTNVPKDIQLTDLVNFIDLNESALFWSEKILKDFEMTNNRNSEVYQEKLKASDYNIKKAKINFSNLYEKIMKEEKF